MYSRSDLAYVLKVYPSSRRMTVGTDQSLAYTQSQAYPWPVLGIYLASLRAVGMSCADLLALHSLSLLAGTYTSRLVTRTHVCIIYPRAHAFCLLPRLLVVKLVVS
jgi:hypothetical protein